MFLAMFNFCASMPLPQRDQRANLPDLDSFMARARDTLLDIDRLAESNSFQNATMLESTISRLQMLVANIQRLSPVLPHGVGQAIQEESRQVIRSLISLRRLNGQESPLQPVVSRTLVPGSRGAPRYDLQDGQLQFLIDHGFTIRQMSTILNPVSERTISRRLGVLNLSRRRRYSPISDEDLLATVTENNHRYPRAGYRIMHSILINQGINVQRRRVRQALQTVDPVGVAVRWSAAIRRRRYRVPSPNSLWHIDTNHALIR